MNSDSCLFKMKHPGEESKRRSASVSMKGQHGSFISGSAFTADAGQLVINNQLGVLIWAPEDIFVCLKHPQPFCRPSTVLRYKRRMQTLRQHHEKCRAHYENMMKCHTKSLPVTIQTKGSSEGNPNTPTEDQASSSDVKEDTQAVIYTLEMEPCSSASMDTVIIQPPDSAAHEQVAVPQLKRTDSILVLDFIREELESDSSEPELSSHTGSDTEYKPTQTASSSSDEEDLKSRDKASSCEKLSSDEDLKGTDTDSREDEDQQIGKSTIHKHKNPRTYVKRKNKKITKKTKTVTIKTCTKREDSKRAWDKRHYCLYCGKSNLKMARHLQRKHMEIKDVAYAFSFPVGSKDRKVLLEQLRNKGDFKHNTNVLEKGRGQLVTWKQPSYKASVADYLPCQYCYGMFAKNDLWRHQSSCRSKKSCVTDDKKKTRTRVQSLAACLLPIASSSGGCQDVINKMRQDDVSFHIRSDPLICSYGESLYAKHGRVKSKHQYIAQKMRELGRFTLAAKDMDKTVKGLEDLCVPSKFQFVVNVTKRLTQFSPGKNEYAKPSTAVKIGFSLKGAVEVLIGQTLMNDDDMAEKAAKKFLELLEKNWKNQVSVGAHQTIQEKRWNKQDDIPLVKNVMALRDHLRMVEDKAKGELTQQLSLTAYKKVNETVLAQVIIFNKRREGEASRVTLETYKEASTNPMNEDIYETLTDLEKEMSKLLTRIEVRGKRGRKVPIFLTERMKKSIDLLIERRDEAGIPSDNPYLFARPGGMTNIRGCDCLRKYAEQSKAEHPELLRSTKLRKQAATLCQLLHLSEQELEQVARFMGHDLHVHRDFYRQTDKNFQIAKISKLLFAMEQDAGILKGKNLTSLNPAVSAESPTSTSVSVPQRRRKRGREVVEDGGSDPCEDGSSDIDDPSTSLAKRLPQKKRGKKKGAVKETDGGADLLSPQKTLDPRDPSTSLAKRLPQKKRGKKKGAVKETDGGSDLFSPKNRPDQSDEDEGSDMEGESPTPTSVSVPQRGRKRGREVDDDGGSDPCEDGSSDIDDQSTRLAKRLPQKKRGKKKGAVKESEAPKVQLKRPWSEAERTAVNKRLGKFMAEHRVPGKEDCVKCITQEKSLDQRSWKDVKNFVYNTIVTLNRRLASRKLLY